ncbi:prephenate dehydrogenase/arogenate dehydrogenase family protein [Muricauda sp. JGD-17]|uniref:Prephenate dehydrogenase/arogenate dehydrogenase family protein n=1 Tax=Flagellimonas ochracea TaxID=2696472 RepID=A0A964TCD4_9FLAO|nr:NADPH-dependent F420 reductase [Allomuricauda ochracea]NAY90901.1 prephenate dehydrogenase/arogenate dehydrogenase family protein [Allomuricauda ochracea]
MQIGFIGIGKVGFALADNLQRQGHMIIIGNDDPNSDSVQNAMRKNSNFSATSIQEMVTMADIIFLATPFSAVEEILSIVDLGDIILVDCTNPVGPGISHGLESKISGSEKIQEWAPKANVIKAFTIYGFENFENSKYPGYSIQPVMLIAGNDTVSKKQLMPLIQELGFEVKDTGPIDQALHLEHMTLLWVKMVRRDGHHPNFVWAYLER